MLVLFCQMLKEGRNCADLGGDFSIVSDPIDSPATTLSVSEPWAIRSPLKPSSPPDRDFPRSFLMRFVERTRSGFFNKTLTTRSAKIGPLRGRGSL
jgi:hypothetical protein